MALKNIETHRYDPTYTSGWATGLNALTGAIKDFDANNLRKQAEAKEEEREEQEKRQMLMQERKLLGREFTPELAENDSDVVKNAKLQAGRDLADAAALANRQYKNGDITIDEWQAQNADLQGQLDKVQQGDQFVNSIAQKYDEMATNPESVSAATSPKAIAVAKAMQEGTVQVRIVDGKAKYSGTYRDAEGNDVEIQPTDIGSENAFPVIIDKVAKPGPELYDFNVQINKDLRDAALTEGDGTTEYSGTTWDSPTVQKLFTEKIESMLTTPSDQISMAVDHLGMDKDEAVAAYNNGTLGETVKNQLLEQSKQQFFGNQKGREDVDNSIRIKNQQAAQAAERHQWARDNQTKLVNSPGGRDIPWGEKSFMLEVDGFGLVADRLNEAVKTGNFSEIPLKGTKISKVENGRIRFTDGRSSLKLPKDPQEAFNMIAGLVADPKVIQAYNVLESERQNSQQNTPANQPADYSNINTGRPGS